MASFRQQMQELADKIARSRAERTQTVSKLPKMREQLKRQVGRLRQETRQALDRTAGAVSRGLKSFNANNKRSVARLLRETHAQRTRSGQALRSKLMREVAQNRNAILRAIQQNHQDRKRMQRSQQRQSLMTLKNVHQRVENLRSGTQRMLRDLSSDRQEARQIWAGLRRSVVTPRQTMDRQLAERAPIDRPVFTPATVVSSGSGEWTGLAMPPVRN